MTYLPESELDAFVMTVIDATGMATVGDVLGGYRCLLAGEDRAQELQENGEPWAEILISRYRLALDRYGERWGLRIE